MNRHATIWGLGLAAIAAATATLADSSPRKPGVTTHDAGARDGYTLLAPMSSTTTYLVDMQGRVVHTWESEYAPGQSVYLLDNGHLLRTANVPGERGFRGGGIGGAVQEFDWDGDLRWTFEYSDERVCLHHDIEPLPNGNVLMLAWERKTRDEAIAAGRDPKNITRFGLWPDHIIEVKPEYPNGGEIVWEWHVWDHLVQDLDPSRDNYGRIAEHPELININPGRTAPRETPAELRKLRSLGYIGGDDEEDEEAAGESTGGDRGGFRHSFAGPGRIPGMGGGADWNHTNSIDYNPKLDQIMLSVLQFNEIWVIDHSTTTAEAASHKGGRQGKGGDLLYRWGNPPMYGVGTEADQQLFAQHDARWIPDGMPGAGNIMIFNNGRGRPDEEYSSIEEIVPPVTASGCYKFIRGSAFGPAKPSWTYSSKEKDDFFASHISGAQRLDNGNTLICDGEQARVFEVTDEKLVVWDYVCPFAGERRPPGFLGRMFGGPRRGAPGAERRGDGGDASDEARSPGGNGDRPSRDGARPQPRRRRGPREFGPPPGGMRPPGGGPGGGPGGLFRATRVAADHPALKGKDLSPKEQPSGREPK